MKASFVSSFSITNALRSSTARLQQSLPSLQQEMVTGRHADSGLSLGSQTASLATLTNDIGNLDRLYDTNNRILTRMSMVQSGMDQLNSLAENIVSTIGVTLGDDSQKTAVKSATESALLEFTSVMNRQADGVYLFAGDNAQTKPIADYAGSALQASFDTAFQTYFGFTKDSPATIGITEAQVNDFITTVAEPLFIGAGWTTNVSSASDNVQNARIEDGITMGVSVSANEEAFQQIAISTIIASEFYQTEVAGDALFAAGKYAVEKASTAISGLTKIQGQLGLTEERISRVNEGLVVQKNLFESFVVELDGVDAYDAAIEVNTLLTQIEVSYSVTSRIQNLSLMQYLR
ncbi:MAG: flagellar hook-associated family protein [Pseudomonadota bacterium]